MQQLQFWPVLIQPMSNQPNKLNFRKTAEQLRHRGIFLLPNLFTTAALFSGFFSVINAMNGDFSTSAIAIFIAMIFDGLDGRVARLTHTQSAFGVEYDSLSDMISFGIAPAILIYAWLLKDASKSGWAAAFIYCAATALRLARFNVNVTVIDKRYFQGLPSPAAAAFIASLVWSLNKYNIRPEQGELLFTAIWGAPILMGLLMVSNFPYFSGKALNFRQIVSTGTIMILAILMVFITVFARNIAEILLFIFGVYALCGIWVAIWHRVTKIFSGSQAPANSSDEIEHPQNGKH